MLTCFYTVHQRFPPDPQAMGNVVKRTDGQAGRTVRVRIPSAHQVRAGCARGRDACTPQWVDVPRHAPCRTLATALPRPSVLGNRHIRVNHLIQGTDAAITPQGTGVLDPASSLPAGLQVSMLHLRRAIKLLISGFIACRHAERTFSTADWDVTRRPMAGDGGAGLLSMRAGGTGHPPQRTPAPRAPRAHWYATCQEGQSAAPHYARVLRHNPRR